MAKAENLADSLKVRALHVAGESHVETEVLLTDCTWLFDLIMLYDGIVVAGCRRR